LLACFGRTEAIRLLDVIETAGLEQVRQRVKALAAAIRLNSGTDWIAEQLFSAQPCSSAI
jgi:hypothetical protein